MGIAIALLCVVIFILWYVYAKTNESELQHALYEKKLTIQRLKEKLAQESLLLKEKEKEILDIRALNDNAAREYCDSIFTKLYTDINLLVHDSTQAYPWLSELFAEYSVATERTYARFLKTKPRPALKKAETVESFASQKKELIRQNKFLEHQLLVYESIFPWLEDFKLIPPDQLDQFSDDNSNSSDEYQSLKNWLSPEEYKTLSSTEKYQLALDRYQRRNKTDWEVGRDYERFIGYYFESDGWQVRYIGATDGKNDRGIDLIATKGNAHYVIQCKRWSPAHRIIRENAICQLAGSAALYDIELTHKGRFDHITTGVFVTTTTLSDIARDVADKLNVSLIEEKQMESYPCIKCHIAADGEKIYHLPFDQQYDRIIMDPLHGDLYVETTEQAESLGFRKAFRWHSKQD